MIDSVYIENDLPAAFRITGIHYRETKELSVNSLSLFIERDLRQFLKPFHVFNPSYEISLLCHQGRAQIRIAVDVDHSAATQSLQQGIESLLWSYNYQLFTQQDGRAKAQKPRFEYRVKINKRLPVAV